jgi:hypothetical protein
MDRMRCSSRDVGEEARVEEEDGGKIEEIVVGRESGRRELRFHGKGKLLFTVMGNRRFCQDFKSASLFRISAKLLFQGRGWTIVKALLHRSSIRT